jgi:hypothetical protein
MREFVSGWTFGRVGRLGFSAFVLILLLVVPYQTVETSAELKTAKIASNARAYTMMVPRVLAKADENANK